MRDYLKGGTFGTSNINNKPFAACHLISDDDTFQGVTTQGQLWYRIRKKWVLGALGRCQETETPRRELVTLTPSISRRENINKILASSFGAVRFKNHVTSDLMLVGSEGDSQMWVHRFWDLGDLRRLFRNTAAA